MEIKEKIKNSIRAYIIGDALGVPFEFRKKGTFKCNNFTGFGTYNKPIGTWSDDTSVLLCFIDALIKSKLNITKAIDILKKNLVDWYINDSFTIDGLFDIGGQIAESIRCEFNQPTSDRMGNGALFYSLPFACLSIANSTVLDKSFFEEICKTTHNNTNCIEYGFKFSLILKSLFLSLPTNSENQSFYNRGDVINTYNMTISFFNQLKNKKTSLMEDLCCIINEGEDTDTNAAILGALMGTVKKVNKNDWEKVRKHESIDKIIDEFIDLL